VCNRTVTRPGIIANVNHTPQKISVLVVEPLQILNFSITRMVESKDTRGSIVLTSPLLEGKLTTRTMDHWRHQSSSRPQWRLRQAQEVPLNVGQGSGNACLFSPELNQSPQLADAPRCTFPLTDRPTSPTELPL
jgi:hypothetical protein